MRRPDAPGSASPVATVAVVTVDADVGPAAPGGPDEDRRPLALHRWGRCRRARRDTGSAVAEFAMVAGLVVILGMAVFQLALTLYVRNALISDASEGARLGARAGSSPAEGAGRTRDLISRELSGTYAQAVSARTDTTAAGVQVVEVTVSAPVPVIGLLGPSGSMTVHGRAFQEGQ